MGERAALAVPGDLVPPTPEAPRTGFKLENSLVKGEFRRDS